MNENNMVFENKNDIVNVNFLQSFFFCYLKSRHETINKDTWFFFLIS